MLCICGPSDTMTGFPTNIDDSCPVHNAKSFKDSQKQEDIELLILVAKDIVSLWPTISLRTSYKMTEKVELLRQALGRLAKS